jgi:transcriptional regulator with XRE-family HTH domain/tetratricopeptide (TPR) repeat protein
VISKAGVTDGARASGTFGLQLSSCRLSAGLSQEELAERSGLSVRTVRNLERGRTKWPHPNSVRGLAEALGLHGEQRDEFIAASGRRLSAVASASVVAVSSAANEQAAVGQLPIPAEQLGVGNVEVSRLHRLGSRGLMRKPTGCGVALSQPWLPIFQMPAAPADFTGRAAECSRLAAALTATPGQPGVPAVVVTGLPGAGKTSLALQVAHIMRPWFADGQLWVHLAGTSARPRDPGEVLGEFLRALGVPGSQIPPDLPGRAACYRSRLSGRRVLVVADDAAAVAQVRPLLPGSGGCAMVVTSRSNLEGMEGAHLLPLDVMTAEDAVGLLAHIVGEDRVAAEQAAAGSLAQACGGLPLALRITGAKLAARPAWRLSVMVRKLTGARNRLRELESAEVSVHASIASSYQSLPERSRRALHLIGLLSPADFTEWAVAALLGEPQAADVVAGLENQSLLTSLGADMTGEPRFRLHDLLHDFATERLCDEPAGHKNAALLRALEGWCQLARQADAQLPPEPCFPQDSQRPLPDIVPPAVSKRVTADPIAWFTAERVNLLAAVEQACEAGWLDLARQLASCQCAFQHSQHRYDDAERQWRVIADNARKSGDLATGFHASLRVGASMIRRGLAADALPILDRCIEMADRSGEAPTLAFALYWRSICAIDLDDHDAARNAAARGVAIARSARARLPEYMNLTALGTALAWLGKKDQAVEVSESALAVASRLRVASYELEALLNLAYTYTLTGRFEAAVTASNRAIGMSRILGDICAEGLAHGHLGDAHYGLGHYRQATANLHHALPVFRDNSARHFQAICLLKLGYAYEAMSSPEATDYLEESLQIFRLLRLTNKADRAQQALNRCKRNIQG